MGDLEVDVVERGPRGVLAARVAGSLLVLLGVANLVLAGVGGLTTALRIPRTTAALLAASGLFTAVLGVFVLRGRRWATIVAVLVFGALFVLQAFAATGGATAPALVTLALVLAPLVLALREQRTN